jgi:DNA-nicking Smr family endonuclease
MKRPRSSSIHRPFKDLDTLLKNKGLPYKKLPRHQETRANQQVVMGDLFRWQTKTGKALSDEQLFEAAMADVTPLEQKTFSPLSSAKAVKPLPIAQEDQSALLQLKNLVDYGQGFVIADTPEYIEGKGYAVSAEIIKRLHRGDYSIQDHLDLHGYNADAAVETLEKFIKNAILNSKRALLIIHGRGLSSPHEPVLKNKVCEWLVRSAWRKWVLAFCSAKGYDGGAGATYLLLRQRPMTRGRHRRQLKKRPT